MEADRSSSEDQTDEEYGRDVRLDADAEEKLVQASLPCKWRACTRKLFRDIVALMRDTGMRNEREFFQIRIENLDWNNRTIFVPDSKTPEGRRVVPMSRRVFDILEKRCGTRTDGWVFPSKRSASGRLRSICSLFRQARSEAGLPKELVLYCARHDYGTRVLMRTGLTISSRSPFRFVGKNFPIVGAGDFLRGLLLCRLQLRPSRSLCCCDLLPGGD